MFQTMNAKKSHRNPDDFTVSSVEGPNKASARDQ